MTKTRFFIPIFEADAIDPARDCIPVGFMTFTRDEGCGDLEPELSLRFKVQDDSGDIEFTIGEEEVDSLITALIAAGRELEKQRADFFAGEADEDELP